MVVEIDLKTLEVNLEAVEVNLEAVEADLEAVEKYSNSENIWVTLVFLVEKSVHCFSPLLVFLRQSFSLGNDPNGNVTLPVSNARARSEPAGRDFRFFAAAAPKVMVLAGQMFLLCSPQDLILSLRQSIRLLPRNLAKAFTQIQCLKITKHV